MQTLYAFNDDAIQLEEKEKFLRESMNNMYNLYLLMLSLMIEVQKKAQWHLEKVQQKHLATEEEKNPSKKLIHNKLLVQLSENESLKSELSKRKLNNWQFDNEYVDVIFKALLKSDLYQTYMSQPSSTFNEDKEFLIQFYKTIVAPNDKLYDYLEDKSITWVDDLPVVNTTLLKLLRKATPDSHNLHFLPRLFRDIEDRDFGIALLKATVRNMDTYDDEIAKKTQNWDKDRITQMDLVLLQMAICELQEFDSIPVKVTINEYLEIAKEYSTPKSSVFINGILDKIVKEYSDKGTLNKRGRGLL